MPGLSMVRGGARATPRVIVEGGDNNPDGYPTSGTTFYAPSFATEVASHVVDDPAILDCVHGANFGLGGGGGWSFRPVLAATGPSEDNAGIDRNGKFGAFHAQDQVPMFILSYPLFMSQSFIDLMVNEGIHFKAHDHRQFRQDGSGVIDDGSESGHSFSRWHHHFQFFTGLGIGDGIYFSIQAGGAGRNYVDVVGNVDFRDFADEWVQPIHVFDGPNGITKIFLKRAGQPCVKILERDTSIVLTGGPDPDDFLVYKNHGFALGERTVFGYCDDFIGTPAGPIASREFRAGPPKFTNFWPAMVV